MTTSLADCRAYTTTTYGVNEKAFHDENSHFNDVNSPIYFPGLCPLTVSAKRPPVESLSIAGNKAEREVGVRHV